VPIAARGGLAGVRRVRRRMRPLRRYRRTRYPWMPTAVVKAAVREVDEFH
jgi:hypothetical protein